MTVMQKSDIAFATKLTDIEKWGYRHDDFLKLLDFEPNGCFIARWDDDPIGMITTTSYDNYGFIGSLIVLKEYRNRKIGEKLMAHAIEYLRKKGVSSFELDAVIKAASLYRRFGFRDKYLSLRFGRKPTGGNGLKRPATVESIDDIIKFDADKTGLNRARMLDKYFRQMPESIYIEKQWNMHGYTIVRPQAGESMKIGPMVCVGLTHAEKLLEVVISKHGTRPLTIGVPEVQRGMSGLLLKYGFEYQPPSLRMYLGERLEYEKHIYAIFSAEKG